MLKQKGHNRLHKLPLKDFKNAQVNYCTSISGFLSPRISVGSNA